MGFDLPGLVEIPIVTETKQRRAIRPELRRDGGGHHLGNETEGQVRIFIIGSETGKRGEGGLVGKHLLGEHTVVDLETARGLVGGEGAKVEEGVVVTDKQRNRVFEGGVEEAEGLGEVLVAGADADLVAEDVLRGKSASLLRRWSARVLGVRVSVRV